MAGFGLSLFTGLRNNRMGKCQICGKESALIAQVLSVCRECIINNFSGAKPIIDNAHRLSRREFNLPESVPRDKDGVACTQCGNRCIMGEHNVCLTDALQTHNRGFCGLKKNENGKIIQLAGTPERGRLEWYYDALPTNCVASWICPEGERGHHKIIPPRRKKNLAVFYAACTFNCLFCQNWHFRQPDEYQRYFSAQELADAVDADTNCVCYFGGDPAAQITHAIGASHIILARSKKTEQNVRICWETNGSMNRTFLKEMMNLSLASGGA